MSTIPPRPEDAIAWLQARITKWQTDPAAAGLTPEDLVALQAELDSVTAALALTVSRRAASKAATAALKAKVKDMRALASLNVARIRTFARGSANPAAVYEFAEIPAPATPGESPAPAQPREFRVSLLQSGALRFTFKCPNPAGATGVTYKVERQDSPQLPFAFLVNAKDKRFEDTSFPNTSALIFYRVTAQTATKDSLPAEFTVRYGAGNQAGGGGVTIVSQGGSSEQAAS